jgi:RimJ/RimL family protein N-acetyltransferase
MEAVASGGGIMMDKLFEGKLVKLVAVDLEKDMELMELWDRDSEYKRQLDIVPATMYSAGMSKEWYENSLAQGARFMIRTVEEDKAIGFVDLDGFNWSARDAWVGIGIGDADYRGKGFGTEAMQLLLRYAFSALNLNRVNLGVFDFNERAIKSYEKCGFKYEGTEREVIYKDDKRYGVINMGILRDEWEALQSSAG